MPVALEGIPKRCSSSGRTLIDTTRHPEGCFYFGYKAMFVASSFHLSGGAFLPYVP